MAGLRKRKGVYYIRFQQVIDGVRNEISRSLDTTRREIAEQKKAVLEEREERGQDPFSVAFNWDTTPKKNWWTVQDCYDGFIAAKDKFRPETIRGYKYVIQKWMDTYHIRERLITSVKTYHFEDFLMRDGIGAATRRSEKLRLKAFWSWCIKTKKVEVDLVRSIELPQSDVEYRSKMITENEFRAVLKSFDKADRERKAAAYFRPWMAQDWFRPCMFTFYYTGARKSEIGVKKGDDKAGLRGENILGVPGKKIEFIYLSKAKKNRERFIPVHSELEKELLLYFERRGWPDPDEFVFVSGRGVPVSGKAMYDAFKSYCKDAKVPKSRTLHGMRHNRATAWLENGWTLKEVKDMLGHYSIAITDEFYTHLTPNKLRDKMKRLEDNS